ncbi:RNA polymerase sigma factor region1.1 domain-containing protein [Microvirga aerophila]|uniref:RNA polymerase sigma factor 70 region 1.1 domain-containing protein n=1 Tax=Microvirga aerophila TaxID=670291 RepID=A0A512C3U5_9HYPH|nr:hypothetical protein MAE02_65760 [Microvirga aerophila]
MTAWKPIATAPRDRGRPLLLYPHPFPRGSSEAIEALRPSDGPLLDLADAAVRRFIKFAKKRGYVTYDELNEVLPSNKFSPKQIKDVLDQLSEMGITVTAEEADESQSAEAEEDGGGDLVEASQTQAVAPREEAADDQLKTPATFASVMDSRWAIYGNVFEGYWDGTRWRSAGGVPCEPTHWMPLPSPPLALVNR